MELSTIFKVTDDWSLRSYPQQRDLLLGEETLAAIITVTVTSAVWDPLLPTVGSDETAIKLGIRSDSSPGHQQIVHRDTAEISTITDSSMPSMDSPISLTTRLIGGTTGDSVGLGCPEDAVSVGCGIESNSNGNGSSGATDSSPSVREGDADDVSEVEPVVIVLFMFFGLGTGIIIMQLLSVVGDPLPYTCVIFVAGMFMSFANKNTAGIFGDSVTMWTDIDPDIMLYVFLPPLIFGEAMSLNWHHVQGGFLQSVLLAGPGVVIGAVLMGVFVKYLLPYNWSWNLAMVFGSILSATDPVAVVALLKSAGASPKLTILIVGESLLNDGTAMVLFTIFYNALNGMRYSAGDVCLFFLAAAVGSVLLGLVIGVVALRWLRTANRPLKDMDITAQIAITICCSYLVFFTAQYFLRISGVLACCGAGVMLAWKAPPLIISRETMHNVWGMIEWILNTFIFLLAGLIIGDRVLEKVKLEDVGYLFVLYLLLMLVRCFVIALLFPLLSSTGHRCTRNEAIFMSWAGLRGALGMALALIVERNCPDDIHDDTSRLFFYVGGIAALTLVINATTAKRLLVHLGLLGDDSAEKGLVMNQIKKRLRRRMNTVLQELSLEFSFTPEDLDNIRQSCSLLHEADMADLYRDTGERASLGLLSQSYSSRSSKMIFKPITASSSASSSSSPSATWSYTAAPVGPSSEQSILKNTEKKIAAATDGDALDEDSTIAPARSLFGPIAANRLDKWSDNSCDDNNSNSNNSSVGPVLVKQRSISRTRTVSFSGTASHSVQQSASLRAGEIARLLSMSNRGPNPVLMPQLLSYVRAVFLEIVKVRYWHDIERGILPRLSHSATYLLYSVEVGLDQVTEQDSGHNATACGDWKVLLDKITTKPLYLKALAYWDRCCTPFDCTFGYATYFLGKYEARKEKRDVYMLTSFIAAHQHAQNKIHEFLVLDDHEAAAGPGGTDESSRSPEEQLVISESAEAVLAATRLLEEMNRDSVTQIRSKQVIALVLTKEAELVKSMVSEGLLTAKHAEEFLEEVSDDLQRMEKDRNKMYWEHGEQFARERQQKKLEGESGLSSLLSLLHLGTHSSSQRSRTHPPRADDLKTRLIPSSQY